MRAIKLTLPSSWSQFLSDQRRGWSSAFLWRHGALCSITLCKAQFQPLSYFYLLLDDLRVTKAILELSTHLIQ